MAQARPSVADDGLLLASDGVPLLSVWLLLLAVNFRIRSAIPSLTFANRLLVTDLVVLTFASLTPDGENLSAYVSSCIRKPRFGQTMLRLDMTKSMASCACKAQVATR